MVTVSPVVVAICRGEASRISTTRSSLPVFAIVRPIAGDRSPSSTGPATSTYCRSRAAPDADGEASTPLALRHADLHQVRDLRLPRCFTPRGLLGARPRVRCRRGRDCGKGLGRGSRMGWPEHLVQRGTRAEDREEPNALRPTCDRNRARRSPPADGPWCQRQAGGTHLVVMADPEGNEFCVE